MLYLTRKIGESVIINDNIEVTVIDIRGKSIKLGFTFPSGTEKCAWPPGWITATLPPYSKAARTMNAVTT